MKLEEKLSRMIQVDTVSQNDVDNSAKFRKFHAVLEELFPSVFKTCSIVKFNEAILLKWKGKSDDGPIVLMSHQDVVEAAGEWKVRSDKRRQGLGTRSCGYEIFPDVHI